MATDSETLEDFLELSNGELQYYLQQRCLPTSGNHETLAARVLLAHEQSIKCIATAAQVRETLKKDYSKLLVDFGIEDDSLVSENFVDNIKSWPKTNIGQIFSYFLASKAFETEYIGHYKLRKAYSFYRSGFVDKIFVKVIDVSRVIIRSSVTPSQRINDLKHQLWILFNINGSVITGFCSCTAGHSKCCNHIAAVLYKIEYANEKGLTNPACTDESCQWNSSAKEICPMKIKDMQLLQHNVGKQEKKKNLMYQEKSNFDPRPTSEREISDSSKLSFLSEVRNLLPKATLNISVNFL